MTPSRRKTSFVWKYFKVSSEDERKAICNKCGAGIVRGKDTRTYSTSSLAAHVRTCGKIKAPRRSPVQAGSKRNVSVFLLDDSEHPEDSVEEDIKRMRSANPDEKPNMHQMLEEAKEPEEYVMPDPRCIPSEDVICSKRMDLIHSGLLLHTLYQQHRYGRFCDLTLISAPPDQRALVTQSHDESVVASKLIGSRKVFKAHSSVLSALSDKVKTLIEMGSRTIELKDVSPFGLKSLLEIVYTGKMLRTTPLRYYETHQVWKAARDLGVDYVRNYLLHEHPQVAKWIQDEESNSVMQQEYEDEMEHEEDLIDMCGPEGKMLDLNHNDGSKEEEFSEEHPVEMLHGEEEADLTVMDKNMENHQGEVVEESQHAEVQYENVHEEEMQKHQMKKEDNSNFVEIRFSK